jgi:hypothetical protein
MSRSGAAPGDIEALEAVRLYGERYGVPSGALKSCIAYLLDGNLGAAARHDAAFCIAIELRRVGLDDEAARRVLRDWAWRIGYAKRAAERGVTSAYSRKPSGQFRYRPPGIHKRGPVYAMVLSPLCAAIGCPANCLPFAAQYRGPQNEGLERFVELGWPRYLRRRRWRASADVYEALCELESRRGFAAGAPMFTHYRQLAAIALVNPRTVGRALTILACLGVVIFQAGSGSGPNARDRVASRVQRIVPIPECPPPI